MKLKKIYNILSDELYLFWEGNKYYSQTVLTDEQKEIIKSIHCTRYYIEYQDSKNIDYEVLSERYNHFLKTLVLKEKERFAFQIITENNSSLPNKVRTYKGIINKKNLKTDTYLQLEILIKEKTIFVALINLNEKNFHENINFFGSRQLSFIVSSENDYMSESFLKEIIYQHRIGKDFDSFDLLSLITLPCNNGDIVYMIGPDERDNEIILDVFNTSNRSSKN